jgi:V-type H+-transporting ATPase subunit D
LDREEFYRLKKVSGKKERDAAAAEKARSEERKKATQEGSPEDSRDSKDLLGDDENEDVIF